MREVSRKATNKTLQRFGKTKRSLLRQQQQQNRPWILRNIIRDFVTKQSWWFFFTQRRNKYKKNPNRTPRRNSKKVKAPQKCCHVTADLFPQTLQTNSYTSPKALWERACFLFFPRPPLLLHMFDVHVSLRKKKIWKRNVELLTETQCGVLFKYKPAFLRLISLISLAEVEWTSEMSS